MPARRATAVPPVRRRIQTRARARGRVSRAPCARRSQRAPAISSHAAPLHPRRYKTCDGTAKAGKDYVATSGVVSLAPGMDRAEIAITIVDDAVAEEDETFTCVLSAVEPAQLVEGGNTICTVKILDDDSWRVRVARAPARARPVRAVGSRAARASARARSLAGAAPPEQGAAAQRPRHNLLHDGHVVGQVLRRASRNGRHGRRDGRGAAAHDDGCGPACHLALLEGAHAAAAQPSAAPKPRTPPCAALTQRRAHAPARAPRCARAGAVCARAA